MDSDHLPFEPTAAQLLFQLVSRRYERGSILITSNRAVGDWDTVLGDQVVATAILVRLLHHRRRRGPQPPVAGPGAVMRSITAPG